MTMHRPAHVWKPGGVTGHALYRVHRLPLHRVAVVPLPRVQAGPGERGNLQRVFFSVVLILGQITARVDGKTAEVDEEDR